MNRLCYWIVALMLLCVGCRNDESLYVITGELAHLRADGNIVYLSHSNGDELINLDSAIVDGGRFTFQGVQEIPIMAYLRFKNPYDSLALPALFILENGELTAHMDTSYSSVSGSLRNQEFASYLRAVNRLDSLREAQYQAYQMQVGNGTMDAIIEQTMYDTDCRWEQEQVQQAYNFIVRNSDSPAALWLLETKQSQFSEEELRTLVAEFSGITKMGKRPPVVEEIVQRLRNANRISEGNPYIDMELTDNRGRHKRLSQYVGYTRYTVVGFWRTDSEPACRNMVKFTRLQRKFTSRGATFLGVALDNEREMWQAKTTELKLMGSSQTIANQPDEVTSRYALASVPSFVVIAPDGTIDSRNLTIDALTTRMEELLPYREKVEKDGNGIKNLPDTTRTEESAQ